VGFLSDREELVDVVHAGSRTNVPLEHPVHVDVVKQGHGNRTSESGQYVFTGILVWSIQMVFKPLLVDD